LVVRTVGTTVLQAISNYLLSGAATFTLRLAAVMLVTETRQSR